MSDLADITLAILAGGEGSRMGKPEGMLVYDITLMRIVD